MKKSSQAVDVAVGHFPRRHETLGSTPNPTREEEGRRGRLSFSRPGTVTHTPNPSTHKAEAKGLLQVGDQLAPHSVSQG